MADSAALRELGSGWQGSAPSLAGAGTGRVPCSPGADLVQAAADQSSADPRDSEPGITNGYDVSDGGQRPQLAGVVAAGQVQGR